MDGGCRVDGRGREADGMLQSPSLRFLSGKSTEEENVAIHGKRLPN